LPGEQPRKLAADRVVQEGLNVRQTEALVARMRAREAEPKVPGNPVLPKDANVLDLEHRLRERFGTKVRLKYAQGKGSLEVAFFSDDDLERILQIVGVDAN
jgi:ParB family chromosome partitioning protein